MSSSVLTTSASIAVVSSSNDVVCDQSTLTRGIRVKASRRHSRNGLRRARGSLNIGSRYDTEQYRRIVSATARGRSFAAFDDAVTADPAPRRFDPVTPHMLTRIEPKHNPRQVAAPRAQAYARPTLSGPRD